MRSAFFALVVLLVATASAPAPKQSNRSVEQQRGYDAQEAANTIASAIGNTVQPVAKDEGCKDRDDKRDSELCAQWKAADAARDAATFAFWTLLVSAVGTGLLVWTLWETRANARRELRAYVSVKVLETGIEIIPGKEVRFTQQAVAHNGGATPAYDFVSFGHIIAAAPQTAAQKLAKPLPIQDEALAGGFVIHAGDEMPLAFDSRTSLPLDSIDAILNGHASLYLYGTLSYLDTFNVRRRTDYCLVLDSKPFRDSYLESMGAPETRIEVVWKTARFHNTAT